MVEPNKNSTRPEPVKPSAAVPEMADPAVSEAVIAAMAQPGKTVDLPNGLKLTTY